MKISKLKKLKYRTQRVVRITYERDYADEAWLNEKDADLNVTPQTHPDAFYKHREELRPKLKTTSPRKKMHDTLSKQQLSKRLYYAGYRGASLKQLVLDIKAGPGVEAAEVYCGTRSLGWNKKAFELKFGTKVSKIVFKFVRASLVFFDEAHYYFSEGFSAMQELFRASRKCNMIPLLATQDSAELS